MTATVKRDPLDPMCSAQVRPCATDDSRVYYRLRPRVRQAPRPSYHARRGVRERGRQRARQQRRRASSLSSKRGIDRQLITACGEQHLQRYVNEFVFRWNARSANGVEDFERAALILKGASGKRLTYRPTDKAQDA